jgi:hypothetical protein
LKKPLRGLFLVIAVVFIFAFAIDWTKTLQAEPVVQKYSPTQGEKQLSGLQSCDSSQGSSIGPLVPGQSTSTPGIAQNQDAEYDGVPVDTRSTRAGFSIATATDPEYWAGLLGSGWYLDWGMKSVPSSTNLEHWQMVRVHEDCITPAPEAIKATAVKFPGQVWIIGNEPDVIWQDDVTAPRYAVMYHELYALIKSSDPTSQVAVGGISQATPLRLQYLDQVLDSYQDLYHEAMPADWWTVHGYVLREEKGSWGVEIPPGMEVTQGELYEVSDHGRLDLFKSQLSAFRQWMAENGYQNTPLALTEFGILMPTSYGFPMEMIASYLEQTFSWLYQAQDANTGYPQDEYHLVQKWAWFSVAYATYPSSDLGDIASGRLTLVGESFRHIVSEMDTEN